MFNYDDIGEKIKTLAKWMFVLGAIGAILSGIGMLFSGGWFVILGFLTALGGSIVSWVSSWLLYGIGEIVDASSTYMRNSRISGSSKQNNCLNNSTSGYNFNYSRTYDTRCAFCGTNLPANAIKCETCGEFVGNRQAQASKITPTYSTSNHRRCPHCGETVKSSTCDMCGKPNNLFD